MSYDRWISDSNPADLAGWRRPWRGSANSPDPFALSPMAFAPSAPVRLSAGWHGWLAKESAWGFPAHRIAGLTSDGNAEISTVLFELPAKPLTLNLEAPFAPGVRDWSGCGYPMGSSAACQSYVLAELQDAAGATIDGFEKEGCVMQNVSSVRAPLLWHGNRSTTAAGVGRSVRLRLFFRRAVIWAVAEAEAEGVHE